jgi:hypothetical protein
MSKIAIATILATLSAAAPALAGNINEREANQQARILRGVGNGSLTAGELYRLERREASIENQEQRMRARNGGHLTPFNKFVLNQRLNNTSNAVRWDKHNWRHY